MGLLIDNWHKTDINKAINARNIQSQSQITHKSRLDLMDACRNALKLFRSSSHPQSRVFNAHL